VQCGTALELVVCCCLVIAPGRFVLAFLLLFFFPIQPYRIHQMRKWRAI
jgi:hypothetical protein